MFAEVVFCGFQIFVDLFGDSGCRRFRKKAADGWASGVYSIIIFGPKSLEILASKQ